MGRGRERGWGEKSGGEANIRKKTQTVLDVLWKTEETLAERQQNIQEKSIASVAANQDNLKNSKE